MSGSRDSFTVGQGLPDSDCLIRIDWSYDTSHRTLYWCLLTHQPDKQFIFNPPGPLAETNYTTAIWQSMKHCTPP
jgi:hypothetical protein